MNRADLISTMEILASQHGEPSEYQLGRTAFLLFSAAHIFTHDLTDEGMEVGGVLYTINENLSPCGVAMIAKGGTDAHTTDS